jgi:hypothetical protein
VLLTELTELVNGGFSVTFCLTSENPPPEGVGQPFRCHIDKQSKYGSNGWGASLPEALAEAVESLKYLCGVDQIEVAE